MQLIQLEAEELEGDTENYDDLWVTLRATGYNKALFQDEVFEQSFRGSLLLLSNMIVY